MPLKLADEKKISNNNQIKINTNQINNSIRSLDQRTKKAIDFAYNRILKFHSKQKVTGSRNFE